MLAMLAFGSPIVANPVWDSYHQKGGFHRLGQRPERTIVKKEKASQLAQLRRLLTGSDCPALQCKPPAHLS